MDKTKFNLKIQNYHYHYEFDLLLISLLFVDASPKHQKYKYCQV